MSRTQETGDEQLIAVGATSVDRSGAGVRTYVHVHVHMKLTHSDTVSGTEYVRARRTR